MTNSSIRLSWGGPLNEADYANLERSWIPRELADRTLIRRVTSVEGADLVGRKDNGSYGGIIFPNVWPGENHAREYRLRRDQPEIYRDASGKRKEKNKYLGPPGRGNLLYFVPGTQPQLLQDVTIPIAITEGEKKAIALHRLAWFGRTEGVGVPRFLPIGLGGVWSFKGTTGKVTGADGSRQDEHGLISDMRRLARQGRRFFVVYDSNVHTNRLVRSARRHLSFELRREGAQVRYVDLPADPGGPYAQRRG